MKLTTEDRKALQDAINVLSGVLQQASPEVPNMVHEWPEDDTHLRGDFWKDKEGDRFRFSDGRWEMWSPRIRDWVPAGNSPDSNWAPFTRTTDPSLPRTWDTLDAVDADVERAIGDYAGICRELARGELSESGWFQRVLDNAPRRWAELPAAEVRNFTNIRETS